jgi:hypothetical protein
VPVACTFPARYPLLPFVEESHTFVKRGAALAVMRDGGGARCRRRICYMALESGHGQYRVLGGAGCGFVRSLVKPFPSCAYAVRNMLLGPHRAGAGRTPRAPCPGCSARCGCLRLRRFGMVLVCSHVRFVEAGRGQDLTSGGCVAAAYLGAGGQGSLGQAAGSGRPTEPTRAVPRRRVGKRIDPGVSRGEAGVTWCRPSTGDSRRLFGYYVEVDGGDAGPTRPAQWRRVQHRPAASIRRA